MRASAESSHQPPFIVARRRGAYVGGHHGISPTSSTGSGSSEGVEERKRRGGVARLHGFPPIQKWNSSYSLKVSVTLSAFRNVLHPGSGFS